MARRPHRSFCILYSDGFNFLSSWQSAVYVGKYITGRLAVWAERYSMHGNHEMAYVSPIESPQAFIDAVYHCCNMVDDDGGYGYVSEHIDEIRELAPEFGYELWLWIREEEEEPPQPTAHGLLEVPTINQLMRPAPVEDIEVVFIGPEPGQITVSGGSTQPTDAPPAPSSQDQGSDWVQELQKDLAAALGQEPVPRDLEMSPPGKLDLSHLKPGLIETSVRLLPRQRPPKTPASEQPRNPNQYQISGGSDFQGWTDEAIAAFLTDNKAQESDE
jgi:hypothetical protein